ncbi:MAG: hypothetical protein JXA20_09085 [Spirochaetes bacterium]|nr:hypothetical protein [Spirochaetota bacterium]
MSHLLILLLSIFGITFAMDSSVPRIRLMIDSVRGPVVDAVERYTLPQDPVMVVTRPGRRHYDRTYTAIPRGMLQIGGIVLYRTGEKRSIRRVAEEVIPCTDYYGLGECAGAIREANGLEGDFIEAGATVLIPGSRPVLSPRLSESRTRRIFPACGLYFTGSSAGAGDFLARIPKFKHFGINTVVFDAKDITGIVNYRSALPLVQQHDLHEKRSIHNIGRLLRALRENRIHSVARIAVFQDHLLAKRDPSLTIRSAKNGGVWNAGSKEVWLDPTNRRVQQYVMDMTMELLELGVEEIQYDYIRFPTSGNLRDARFAYDFGRTDNKGVITGFLKRAHREVAARNALLSIDIFGVVAWGKECDIRSTGQDIALVAKHCDVISPMLYPSHFNDDFDGFSNPGDNPYHFIYEGCRKVMLLSGGRVVVRPWLQAFRWRVSNYNAGYIEQQVKASLDSGAKGYLFWNASNDYKTVYRALGNGRGHDH